jgi:uncharacterized membrane protein YkvI
MRQPHDHVTATDTSGGGAVIAGLVVGAITLMALLLLFGERLYTFDADLPKVEATTTQ